MGNVVLFQHRILRNGRVLLPLVLLLLFFSASALQAAPVPSEFGAANQAYTSGDFKTARDGYLAIVASGHRSADLFYNLGNANYRLGEKGTAILAWERALALNPSHAEARANLRLARAETGARVAEAPLWQRVLVWPQTVTRNNAAWVAIGAFWVVCFSLLPIFGKRRVVWLPATLGVVALFWAGGAVAWKASQGADWIVTANEVRALTAPADTSKTAGVLPAGSRVQLLMEQGEWLCILLPDDTEGWVQRGGLEPVIPGA